MYEYEQKFWNGKKWEPIYSPILKDKKYSETSNEEVVNFADLSWIECIKYCYNNIENIEIKQTWRKKLKIRIYTGDVFFNGCTTLTEKNYKKFKVGIIYTKVVTLKDKQQALINDYIKSH